MMIRSAKILFRTPDSELFDLLILGKSKKNSMLLAGDIGGTKTNLGIFKSDKSGGLKIHALRTFSNADYESLKILIDSYLSNIKSGIEKAVFAVAGHVTDGQSKMTNLPWLINEKQLQNSLHIP